MLAVFGIESDGLNLAVNLLILFLVVIYLALAYWTYADARRRIADPMLVGCGAAAAILFPFVGAIVYMIVRPPEYLDDVRMGELDVGDLYARHREALLLFFVRRTDDVDVALDLWAETFAQAVAGRRR